MLSPYTPRKIIYAPNDPFFEEGNIALRAYWLERDAATAHDIELIREEANLLAENIAQPIRCEQSSCTDRHGHPLEFPSTAAYEAHYEARHRYVCSACRKIFPSSYFLQLHIDEFHNVLLEIRKERGEKVFRCFVQSCTKSFISPKMRRLHLVDKHHFPKYYDFDIIATGTVSFEERQRRPRRKCSAAKMDIDHSTETKPKKETKQTKESMDTDMDMLTDQMTQLRMIPRSISFGRAKPSLTRKKI